MKVIEIDKQRIKDSQAVVNLYDSKGVDPLTNEKVSKETYKAAKAVVKIFSAIVFEKEARTTIKDIKGTVKATKIK